MFLATLMGCCAAPDASDAMKRPFLINEAPLPRGYPVPGAVGVVVVKEYPPARAATVRSKDIGSANQNRLFRPLFNHIKKNDIAMTAPVVMDYDMSPTRPRTDSMAFLYQDLTIGEAGTDGDVTVSDLPALTVASIGVRGSYSDARFTKAVSQLERWLATEGSAYTATGPPRLLGYNSPFVPWFLRYGEVQIPIRRK
jgi:hypothetical protein